MAQKGSLTHNSMLPNINFPKEVVSGLKEGEMTMDTMGSILYPFGEDNFLILQTFKSNEGKHSAFALPAGNTLFQAANPLIATGRHPQT